MIELISKSMKAGMNCLWNLGTAESKRNFVNMAAVLSRKDSARIVCNETDYNWENVQIKIVNDANKVFKEKRIKHIGAGKNEVVQQ